MLPAVRLHFFVAFFFFFAPYVSLALFLASFGAALALFEDPYELHGAG
jgi:hypothetical protein